MNEATRARIVTGFLAGGYLLLLVETYLDHLEEFAGHWPALFGPVTGLLGALVLGLAAAFWQPVWQKLGLALGGWSTLVGLIGFVLHNEDRLEDGFDFAPPMIPPLLAPLAFAGLGMLVLLVLWPNRAEVAGGDPDPS